MPARQARPNATARRFSLSTDELYDGVQRFKDFRSFDASVGDGKFVCSARQAHSHTCPSWSCRKNAILPYGKRVLCVDLHQAVTSARRRGSIRRLPQREFHLQALDSRRGTWGRRRLWFEQTWELELWEPEFVGRRRHDWSWRRSRRCRLTSSLRFRRSRWRFGF